MMKVRHHPRVPRHGEDPHDGRRGGRGVHHRPQSRQLVAPHIHQKSLPRLRAGRTSSAAKRTGRTSPSDRRRTSTPSSSTSTTSKPRDHSESKRRRTSTYSPTPRCRPPPLPPSSLPERALASAASNLDPVLGVPLGAAPALRRAVARVIAPQASWFSRESNRTSGTRSPSSATNGLKSTKPGIARAAAPSRPPFLRSPRARRAVGIGRR